MKIATYHKLRGDEVVYVMGKNRALEQQAWDQIYITSVFTYDLKTIVETIKFYRGNFANIDKINVGGIAATLMAERLEAETGVSPHRGLLDTEDDFLKSIAQSDPELSYLQECSASIDNLPPDYSIFEDSKTPYAKILDNAFFFYTTKGCPNQCKFCAVRTLEPIYVPYIPIAPRIEYLRSRWGDRAGLLLLDNNIADSKEFFRIIDEIKDCGFGAADKVKCVSNGRVIYKQRYVDFNQGVDLRRMDRKKMEKMAEIAIKPLRLAFDNISLASEYDEKMRLAIDCGITNLSNYMLYNFKDSPIDLYKRFQVNLQILKDHPQAKIFSFPMRYSPIDKTDRAHVGEHWTKREIRAVQLIINATHGIVSHKLPFFERAFGHSPECFQRVLLYPFHYLINRNICEYNNLLIQQWEHDYSQLTENERVEFKELIKDGFLKDMPATNNMKIRLLLEHYEEEYADIREESTFLGGLF